MAASFFWNAKKLADGSGNPISPGVGLIFEYLSGQVSGADDKLITGTAGTSGNVAMWNADGDVVDGSVAASSLTTEAIQDLVGAMVTGNTETNITVTYQDADGTIDFEVSANPQFTTIELGHASDTTLARVSAGIISVEGVNLIRGALGSTDNLVPRADGTGGNLLQAGVGLTISDAGEVTNASQPAFLACNSASDTNQTGNGATPTVELDTEIYDQGSDFNTTTDTFTAPVTGKYPFNCQTVFTGINESTADRMDIYLVTSNRNYTWTWQRTNGLPANGAAAVSALADMDANDTATMVASVSGMAGNTVTIYGDGTTLHTFMSGYLAC